MVIVIEAVDKFVDCESAKEANIAFWLPETFPKNVKVIVSARKHSESIHHLSRIGCEVVDIRSDLGIAESINNGISEKSTCLTEQMRNKYQTVLDELLPKVTKSNNVYSFLEFYAGVFLPKDGPVEWTEVLERNVSTASLSSVSNIN